jgi:hypothetical protein
MPQPFWWVLGVLMALFLGIPLFDLSVDWWHGKL